MDSDKQKEVEPEPEDSADEHTSSDSPSEESPNLINPRMGEHYWERKHGMPPTIDDEL